MNRFRNLVRAHRTTAALIGVLMAAALVAGAALFEPWRLFTSSNLNEALPVAVSPQSALPPAGPSPTVTSGAAPSPSAATPSSSGPMAIRTGTFQSQEHETSGSAQLLMLPDGSYLLRLENLASSDGPDVKVWLSTLEAGGDWFKYRSGRYVDLGAIKATHGNHNYVVPPGSDITGLTSVVLWCDRFSVAFGSAALA